MEKKFNAEEKETPVSLSKLIILLAQQFSPLQIYQFAKIKHKAQSQSIFIKWSSIKEELVLLLLVTKDESFSERQVQNFADGKLHGGKVIVQVFSQAVIFKNGSPYNGFFANVLLHGVLRYGEENIQLNETLKQPNPKKRIGKAISHWRSRSQMAKGFFEAGDQALEHGHERVSLFLFHHATEQLVLGLIYVFLGYRPNPTNLKKLLLICACFSNLPVKHFMGSPENEKLLKVMMESIQMGGGGEPDTSVQPSIYRFLEMVEAFMEACKELCDKHFKGLEEALAKDNAVAECEQN